MSMTPDSQTPREELSTPLKNASFAFPKVESEVLPPHNLSNSFNNNHQSLINRASSSSSDNHDHQHDENQGLLSANNLFSPVNVGIGTPRDAQGMEMRDWEQGREEWKATQESEPALTRKQQLIALLKKLKPLAIEWALQPTHTAAIWLFMVVSVVGLTLGLVMVKLLPVDDKKNKQINENCMQILCLIMTLMALANHPQRLVWLYQKCFRAPDNRAYFDRFFCFDAVWPRRTWIILIAFQLNCFGQYAWQFGMLYWKMDTRPVWPMPVSAIAGVFGVGGGVLLGASVVKYMKMKEPGQVTVAEKLKKYEELLEKARELDAMEWRVSIHVERPGQTALRYNADAAANL